jgi:hypothetical protein
VRTPDAVVFYRMTWCADHHLFCVVLAGNADKTGATAAQALVYKLRTVGLFVVWSHTQDEAPTTKKASEKKQPLKSPFI